MRRIPDHRFPALLSLLVLVLCLVPCPGPATAADPPPEADFPAHLTGDFKAAIVVDARTGLTLVDTNADVKRQPASMLKMMTELIVLQHVADGDVKMSDPVKVSAKASKMGGSQVYLKQGEVFTVEELLMALTIHSANDAAVALAEHIAGSTDAFVDLMNMKARELGMKDSSFHSVHGLPPARGQQPDLTTARDLSRLARRLVKFPQALKWASTKTAPFRGGKFTLYNPNKLVGNYRGLDGLKTGYTRPAGFCVTATAVQKGQRLISVVMGCSTDRARANETTRLLTFGFNAYRQVPVFAQAGSPLPSPLAVTGGKSKTVPVTYAETITVSVPRGREQDLVFKNKLPDSIAAPVKAGARVGNGVVLLDGVELGRVPVVTLEAVDKGNWFNRLLK